LVIHSNGQDLPALRLAIPGWGSPMPIRSARSGFPLDRTGNRGAIGLGEVAGRNWEGPQMVSETRATQPSGRNVLEDLDSRIPTSFY
jgi:hypothetical protein